jgi:hypothetical protein
MSKELIIDPLTDQIQTYFDENPEANELLRVGDTLFLLCFHEDAIIFSTDTGLPVVTIKKPNPEKDKK